MTAFNSLETSTDPRITLELDTENTYTPTTHPQTNLLGGATTFGGRALNIPFLTNGAVTLSTHVLEDKSATLGLKQDFAITDELGEPYTTGAAARTFATLSSTARNNFDDLKNKFLIDDPFTLKVGTDDTFANFDVLATGKVGGVGRSFDGITYTLDAENEILREAYPKDTFDSGPSEGRPVPLVIGSVNGYKPPAEIEGVYVLSNDGVVSTDHEFTRPPIFMYDRGEVFTQERSPDIEVSPTQSESGFPTVARTSLAWTQSGDDVVNAAGLGMTARPSGDGVTLTPDGNDIILTKTDDAESIIVKNRPIMRWIDNGDGTLSADGNVKCTATIGAGVTLSSINERGRASHFKVVSSSSGAITISFNGNYVKNLVLTLRAVRDPVQTVTGITPTPESINPALGSSEVKNHKMTFTDLGTDDVSFTYAATNAGYNMAVIIDYIEVCELTRAEIVFDFDARVRRMSVLHRFENDSATLLDYSNYSSDASSVDGDGYTVQTYGTFSPMDALEFRIAFSLGFGEVRVSLDDILYGSVAYGVFVLDDEEIIRFTPPPENGNFTGYTIYSALLEDYSLSVSPPDPVYWVAKFEARLVSDEDLDTVVVRIGYPGTENIVVGREWASYETEFGNETTNIRSALTQFRVDRGTNIFTTNTYNPDVDFSVELRYFIVYPRDITQDERHQFFIDDDGDQVQLPHFRVADVYSHTQVPKGFVLYDTKGRARASTDYRSITVNTCGLDPDATLVDALRTLSIKSTGTDYVTTSVSTGRVGMVIDSIAPFTERLRDLCARHDLFYREDLTTTGVSVFERWRYDDYAKDFELTDDDIVAGSIEEGDVAPRKNRYVFEYDADLSNPTRTLTVTSDEGYIYGDEQRIRTYYRDKADVEPLAATIVRDSVPNTIYTLRLKNMRPDLMPNMRGFIVSTELPKRKPCLITRRVVDLATRETVLTVKMFRGAAAYG